MKNKLIVYQTGVILFTFFSHFNQLSAQSWKWGVEGKGAYNTFANSGGGSVATDKDGNAYLTGEYTPIIVFGADTLNVPMEPNAYLVKFDSSGNLVWTTQPRQGKNDIWSSGEGGTDHVDNSGNIYVVGAFWDTLYFGTFKIVAPTYKTQSSFLVKYNSNATVLWALRVDLYPLGGAGYLATDNSGNVFISGSSLDSNFQSKYFIIKYNSNGSRLWARNTEWATLTGGAYSTYVATDKAGNSYVTGDFLRGSASFGIDTLTTKLKYSAYLIKYDSNGNFQWVANPKGGDSANGYNYGMAVVSDNYGNIYLTGVFTDTVTFGLYSFHAPIGVQDMFFVKYDSKGNVIWAKASSGGYLTRPTSLCSDSFGDIYIGGIGDGNISFGSLAFHPFDTTSEYYSYLIKVDTSGNVLCGSLLDHGASDISPPLAIASDPTGNYVYLSAVTNRGDTVIAGPDMLVANYSPYTPYVARWQPCANSTEGESRIVRQKSFVNLFPNPSNGKFTIQFKTNSEQLKAVEIYNVLGEKLFCQYSLHNTQFSVDLSSRPNGIYFYRVVAENGELIGEGKLIIQK